MTADEYRRWFATQYGMNVPLQKEMGMVPEKCDCGSPRCCGWIMVHKEPMIETD